MRILRSLWNQPQLMDCVYYNLYGTNPNSWTVFTTISMETTPTHGLCLLQSLWKQPPTHGLCILQSLWKQPQLMDCVYNNLNGNNPNSISLTVQLTEWAQPVDHLLILKCPTNKYLRHSQSRQPIGMQTNYKKWRKVPKLYLQTISPVT